MKISTKPLERQVMVVTGASSGIGLVTARRASRAGVRLVLAARNGDALRTLGDELRDAGGESVEVVADVCRIEDVRKIAETAIATYGGFDTWVNNAGVGLFGKISEVPIEDQRQLFETNYWGVVHGSIVAMEHLRTRTGVIINMGSVTSDRAVPLQGAYSASKHAIKAFTDALRMEIEKDALPIAVTLIKPGSIDTPFPLHAKNYLIEKPKLPPPVYAPEVVAEAILKAAVTPMRDVFVGASAKALSWMGARAPRATDLYMERTMFRQQRRDELDKNGRIPSLYRPAEDGEERGGHPGRVMERSLYTRASMSPMISLAALLGFVGLFGALAYARTR
ncbi:SDR family oxidoreductase [Myxococcota bacterium]|nr:SDR family oxidoreductase [Myxococcota bacterium]